MAFRSLAVFCGSQNGNDPLYVQHAVQLGELMAQRNIDLIYGGGNVGIMGAIANTVMENGGRVTGVIPKVLVEWERQHNNLTELIVTEDMHIRKKTIYSLCDAAVVLAGGFGTLDEFFEMLTWNQLSIHDKNIYVLNTKGYYDHLLAHIRHMQQEKFLYEDPLQRITVLSSPHDIVPYLDRV